MPCNIAQMERAGWWLEQVSGRAGGRKRKRARKAAREEQEAEAWRQWLAEIERVKAEAKQEVQAELEQVKAADADAKAEVLKLKAENAYVNSENARLKADNDQLWRHFRPVLDTPAPGPAPGPVGALNDLQLMTLLDRSFGPTWVMKQAESGDLSLRYYVGSGDPTVRLNVEYLRCFANCVANYSYSRRHSSTAPTATGSALQPQACTATGSAPQPQAREVPGSDAC